MKDTSYPAYYGTGCYIDESHGSADECNARTIDFAIAHGFSYAGNIEDEKDSEDFSQILSEIADDAVDYLNECETRDGFYWTFEDNSLYLLNENEIE